MKVSFVWAATQQRRKKHQLIGALCAKST